MYTIYVKFECVSGMRKEFVDKMKNEGILDAIRTEKGCIMYEYFYSDSELDTLLLIEKWESKEHQQIHIAQPHMDRMRNFKDDYIISTVIGEVDIK